MYEQLKKIYFLIPFKKNVYTLIKFFYTPTLRVAGYLKFKGWFILGLDHFSKLHLKNDNSTLPTILFWLGVNGYETATLRVWQKLSKSSVVVFDLGANFGLFGLIANAISRNSVVHFFEPLPRNVKRIKSNVQANNFSCKINEVAVGNMEGEVVFFDMKSEENTIGSISKEHVMNHSHSEEIVPIKVKMISIDQYVNNSRTEGIDLLKIDVEGAEHLVVEGAIQSIKKFLPHVIIEISKLENASKISAILKSNEVQYNVFEIDEELGLIQCNSLLKTSSRNFLLSRLTKEELELL